MAQPEFAQDLGARPFGHHLVEQDQIVVLRVHHAQGLDAARCDLHMKPAARQAARQHVPVHLFVVDNQKALFY
jgi:hypothetical protein